MSKPQSPSSRFIGPSALAATLSVPRKRANNVEWQYHPRSDHHSKVICLLIAMDLLAESPHLQRCVKERKVAFGINHTMTEHESGRKKDLDLVIHRLSPHDTSPANKTFRMLLDEYGIVLTSEQRRLIESLPEIPVVRAESHSVRIALEAKACMTAFQKARPRLYDELSSSHLTIHGDSPRAIAAGLAMVNAADSFVSPTVGNNKVDGPQNGVPTSHQQPKDYISVVEKLHEIKMTNEVGRKGFDAFGILIIDCKNDNSPVVPVDKPKIDLKTKTYGHLIMRMADEFQARFPDG